MRNNELALVEKIRKGALGARGGLPRLGIGDDAAVVGGTGPEQELLITTDLVVEGSHFDRTRHPARALGHKVLARGLSDIAAMGGKPLYALLSLCVPRWFDGRRQKQFLAGLFGLAKSQRVALIGGDLAAGQRFVADIVVLGQARRGRTLERGKAKVGDIIYVSGRLGGSALGLERLRKGGFGLKDPAVHRHLYPTPRLDLGEFLATELRVRAAMDLSDGLSLDLYRLAAESGVGAEIRAAEVPVFPGATLAQALDGGEDYELLFTASARRKALRAFRGIPLTAIGKITAGRRLTLVGVDGRRAPLQIRGFQHRL